VGLIVGVIFVIITYVVRFKQGIEFRKKSAESEIGSAEQEAKKIIASAYKASESKKRELLFEAKSEIYKSRIEIDKEIKERQKELQSQQKRLLYREETIDKKMESIDQKEAELAKKSSMIEELQQEALKLKEAQFEELKRISNLSLEEAKECILKRVEEKVRHEAAVLVKTFKENAKQEAAKESRRIIVETIQRCAVDHTAEFTVSTVALPSDEMKGRIIGREGRNIRAIEYHTQVTLIIDDTDFITISGFNQKRREIARLTLERLMADGRIHPARIEEMVEKCKRDIDNEIRQEGEKAEFDTGVHGLHPEVIRLLGELKFRTSYGQNVLKHSIEVAQLAGLMAAELGLDIKTAKRAGLLHDIGKAIDHEVEGPHAVIGADILKKYEESNEIINAVLSHHGDVEPTTIIAILVQVADSISASRPGARMETLEAYVKRVEKLEQIANAFDGVENAYVLQAGREIRVIVKPGVISDDGMVLLSRDISERIENECEYPGHIKVVIIRETRSIDYAK